jgi:hypothetical protein
VNPVTNKIYSSNANASSVTVIDGALTSTFTIDVSACIDGETELIIKGNTLQWYNISFRVPGNPETCSVSQTTISTTQGGSLVLSNVAWTPIWPDDALNNYALNVYSSTFSGLSPALPVSPLSVTLDVIQKGYALTIVQLPTTANGGVLILDFNDAPIPGSDIYEALLTITTTGGS